jgi:hypothetical protein
LRKLHALLLPVVLLALASCLYACGDSASDKETIARTIETAQALTDPGDCTELMTQAFVEQETGDEGVEAVEGCEQYAESVNPPVEVSNIEVDGSNATADVTYSEGAFAFAGQTLTVALVEEDGGWKLDETIRFAKLDQLDQRKVVNKLAEGWGSPAEDDCIRKALGEWSRPELEEFLVDGSERPFDEILISCVEQR